MMSAKPKPKEILFGAALGIPTALIVYFRLKYPTLWKDIKAIQIAKQRSKMIQQMAFNKTTIVDIFEQYVQNQPNKPLLLYKDDTFTYLDVDKEANKIARFVQQSGVLHLRDTVALFLHNEPDFIWTWLGFIKLGIATAFINYNLRLQSLLHCIEICGAKAVVCGKESDLLDALLDILPDLKARGIVIWVLGRHGDILPADVSHLDTRIYSGEPVPSDVRKDLTLEDMAVYIFTSGTSGLPKACNIPHRKLFFVSLVQMQFGVNKDDLLYTPMPLYHVAAFALGVLNMLRVGGTTALADRFSASQYWDDVRKYRATISMYIGEMCRFLLAQPRRENDGQYPRKIRYALGNGMRPDIWEEFQERFNIGHIAEGFGATEGNFSIVNLDGKVGSFGQYTGLFKEWYDLLEIVRYKHDTYEPMRGKDGFCIPVKTGEPCLCLYKITTDTPFYGYRASTEANEKKIVRNVKRFGDEYFNIGDLITQDSEGYLYFHDRVGDTFRWKGENVATTEVEETLNKFPNVLTTNVYGVAVPGNDGKAGMAAVVFKDKQASDLDHRNFYSYAVKHLPLYACPKFIRVMSTMPVTGTFKQQKSQLAKEGFDRSVISDPLYVMDVKRSDYVPLSEEIFREILIGNAKL